MPRFFQTPDSHLLLTDRSTATISFLDRRARDRRGHWEMGSPASFTAQVAADDPEINILHTDGFSYSFPFQTDYPFLAEGVRLLYWLRRERPLTETPYVCRFAGPILQTEDSSDENTPRTNFTAYDPWAVLFRRPCLRCVLNASNPKLCADDGFGLPEVDPIPKGQVVFGAGTELQYIAGEMLRRTISANGAVMIDAGDGSIGQDGDGNDYGGTAFWGGTIEVCATLVHDWIIQDGTSVGECWRQLEESGLLKIILTPIYDPVNRPGYCAELNIFRTDSAYNGLSQRQDDFGLGIAGFPLFSWDRSGRDITEISRLVDGNERANKIQLYGPNNNPAAIRTSADSITRFGQYWGQVQYNRLTREDYVGPVADREQILRQQGRRTWQFSPTPEFTYSPFRDYDIGWFIYLYHSNRLREDLWETGNNFGQILGFDIDIDDSGAETVSGLLFGTDDGIDPDAP